MRALRGLLLVLIPFISSACGGGGGSGGGFSFGCGGQLYAAQGRGSTSGNLYLVNPTNASTTLVGPIGFPVGAMAISPTCELYAVTAGSDAATNGRLITINRLTGAGTQVALLQTAAAVPYRSIAGIAFSGGLLYGWVANGAQSGGQNNELVRINTITGVVTPIGGNDFAGDSWEGNGLAFAPNNTLFGTSYDGDNMLLTINTGTGVGTKVANFTQGSTTADSVKALVFVNGVLHAIEHTRGNPSLASLVTINTTTAVTTPVGLLPNDTNSLAYAP
jgi:hypothetical protein